MSPSVPIGATARSTDIEPVPAGLTEDTMTSTTMTEWDVTEPVRPRPGPGYRVVPPAVDPMGPWVAVLDQQFAPGTSVWTMGPEGALVPVPLSAEAAAQPRRKTLGRSALGARLGAILRR
jgi:hypothetical protein